MNTNIFLMLIFITITIVQQYNIDCNEKLTLKKITRNLTF